MLDGRLQRKAVGQYGNRNPRFGLALGPNTEDECTSLCTNSRTKMHKRLHTTHPSTSSGVCAGGCVQVQGLCSNGVLTP